METFIKSLLENMTLEEKIGLLHGNGIWKTRGCDRLNIPDIIMTDGTHGVRYNVEQIEGGQSMLIEDFADVVYSDAQEENKNKVIGTSKPATCFPNGCSLACSFDTTLIEQMGQALGEECQGLGVGILLGPGINIRRMPLAGRGFEYYSEDPVVSGDIAAALIRGIQSQGVGASLKHFACNNSEYLRNTNNSVVEERALREIYLYGFERAIEKSNPWTMMSSYNRLNGEQASSSEWLLTEVLRKEWGYGGVVISDWYGVVDKVKSLLAGNDLEMPETPENAEILLQTVRETPELEAAVDSACCRILQLIFRIKEKEQKKAVMNCEKHHQLARKIAGESIVLLKNEEQLLPLDRTKIKKIAVIGKGAAEPILQGSGAATTTPAFIDIPLEEIRKLAGEEIAVEYAVGAGQKEVLTPAELKEAQAVAKHADVVILFANTPTDENGEDSDAVSLNLCPSHEELIQSISQVNPNLVVVLSNGDSIVMPWLTSAKAVLETFFSGQGMGNAVAEILFGLINPSGKLTVTMPNTLEETPAFLHYPGENGDHIYGEGIYVGYRYYDKRRMKPLFPFGYGLSYTSFLYSNLTLSCDSLKENDELTVTVQITNTGNVYGKETTQLYISDIQSRLPRPIWELKAFEKMGLEPGEMKQISFVLKARDFSYYDPSYQKWIFESGTFIIGVGSSHDDLSVKAQLTAVAKKYYPAKLTENVDMGTALAHPTACLELADLLSIPMDDGPDGVKTLVAGKMGMLTFMNLRSALKSTFHIVFTDEEYRTWITNMNRRFEEGV